jgi:hypothetical protein
MYPNFDNNDVLLAEEARVMFPLNDATHTAKPTLPFKLKFITGYYFLKPNKTSF